MPAPATQTLAKTTVTKTKINNYNIKDLVYNYIYFRHRLPDDLRDMKIGDWDVSKVTDMSQLFAAKETFNEPLNDWNVSQVKDMEYMFLNASQFDQPLDKWNVSKVKNMEKMFQGSSLMLVLNNVLNQGHYEYCTYGLILRLENEP